jgi:hypothetical protein
VKDLVRGVVVSGIAAFLSVGGGRGTPSPAKGRG